MGKLIDEQTAYDVLTDYYHHTTDAQHTALREALGRVETVDAVPVVRCKDCKWYGYYSCEMGGNNWMRDGNGFCDRGELKEGDYEKAD